MDVHLRAWLVVKALVVNALAVFGEEVLWTTCLWWQVVKPGRSIG